ncbi:bifunctional 6-phosphofructo-2-kinase/fructose-2,6-bisphosphate 2-phosphatase, partial [Nadsonia fulvescens var. elongata DSM 6958]
TFDIPGLTKSKVSPDGTVSSVDLGSKLVVVMVGLPARGKSFITNKLCRYLTWQQHRCKIFNVGNTRRNANTKGNEVDDLNPTPSEKQDASFFSPSNAKSKALRELWAMDTLDKLLDYILLDNGTVGILDATNTTIMRRRKVLDTIAERTGGQLKVLFLESICTKPEIINQNIRLKLSGPDYKNIDPEIAIKDFINRLKNYEQAYETLDDEKEIDLQYCKIIDVGARTITNNIKGFLACQVVFFMLNFNLTERQIWICRHGESEDNVLGRIGGDSGITERGKKFSRTLARFMEYQKSLFRKKQLEHFASHNQILSKKSEKNQQGGSDDKSLPMTPMNEPEDPNFCVWSSMLRRSVETAEYFSEEKFDIKEMRMLNELSAGKCEGMTYAEIRDEYPSEYESRMAQKILYRYPGIGGESYLDVIARLRPVIVEIERMEDHLCIIAHRIVCRVLLAYFMNLGRDSIGELDVPLHTLYVLEPKPYGVDWAMYEYSEKADWFFQVPKEN